MQFNTVPEQQGQMASAISDDALGRLEPPPARAYSRTYFRGGSSLLSSKHRVEETALPKLGLCSLLNGLRIWT